MRMSGVLLRGDQDTDTHKDDPVGTQNRRPSTCQRGSLRGKQPCPYLDLDIQPPVQLLSGVCDTCSVAFVMAALAGPNSRSAPHGFSPAASSKDARGTLSPSPPWICHSPSHALKSHCSLTCFYSVPPTNGGVRCPICPVQHGPAAPGTVSYA